MKDKRIVNARKTNKMRFILGITICSLVVVMTFTALSLSLTDFFKTGSTEAGIGTLKMFTTISNSIAAFAAAMCLPFQIDGLRRDRYRLPSWIVIVMYAGTVGVFLTFIMSMTIVSAYQGFVETMFTKAGLFMHTINPILITVLFVLVISDMRIKFSYSFFSLIPVCIYMVLYFVMVFVAKVWTDHYQTNTFMPWPVTLILVVIVSFGISQGLRVLHNLMNKLISKRIERYYKESPDFDFPLVSNAIAHLAKLESKFYYEGDDVYIPVDIIQFLSDRYNASKVPVDILYDIYLENYLFNIGKKSESSIKAYKC